MNQDASSTHKNKDMILYLDMDGVLVNFNKGFETRTNGIGLLSYTKQFGNPAAKSVYLDAGEQWWSNLEWISGGKEVWNTASSLFERVCVLSSAGTSDVKVSQSVIEGKRAWLQKHIPTLSNDRIFIVLGKNLKQEFSTHNSILVDDVPETINQWNAKGGYGILHNSNDYKKTLIELKQLSTPIKISEIAKRCTGQYL